MLTRTFPTVVVAREDYLRFLPTLSAYHARVRVGCPERSFFPLAPFRDETTAYLLVCAPSRVFVRDVPLVEPFLSQADVYAGSVPANLFSPGDSPLERQEPTPPSPPSQFIPLPVEACGSDGGVQDVDMIDV